MPKIVLVSGVPSAGKTTLAELLRDKCGWIHFDGDCWTVGRDPVTEAGANIMPEDFQNAAEEVPEITKLKMELKDVVMAILTGGHVDLVSMERFYGAMIAKIQEVRAEQPGKEIVLSRATFVRQERDVLRKLLGNDFACVMLCASPALLGKRKVERAQREAEEAGRTFKKHVMAYPAMLVPGNTFEERVDVLSNKSGPFARLGAKEGDAEETDTLNIRMTEATSRGVILGEACAFLGVLETV
jgi:chloramphenicol 3-O-phosphotransferase